MKYLIVGLGNIGPEYHETRHNIGFMVADALAKEAGTAFKDGRYGFTTTLSIKGRQLILLKPSTFMNLSGNAVRYWMQKENIPLENVLIVVDDLALPFGTLRLKGKGSDAGHNGLKHIAATLGTQNYARPNKITPNGGLTEGEAKAMGMHANQLAPLDLKSTMNHGS